MDISLKVATLNFTGINNSPFEYHDGSEEKELLSNIFLDMIKNSPSYNGQQFKWDVNKIDAIIQKERYTVIYNPNAGFVKGKLVNKQEFDLLWNNYYEINEYRLAKQTDLTEDNRNQCQQFDWLIYLALVKSVYGEVDIEKIKEYDAKIFKQKLKQWHSKAYLQVQPKVDKVINYILKERLSVLFLQETGSQNWEACLPPGYKCKQRETAMIIYSSNFQDQPESELSKKYDKLLDFNDDSVFIKSKDHLFISGHLSSKAKNIEQANAMYDVLDQILNQYPNIKIVIGMDANHSLKTHKRFSLFPSNEITTRKRRTYIQLQYHKSDKLVEETKDYLVTNLSITKGIIQTIDGKQGKALSEQLIPNDVHPYDHFIVRGNIMIRYERDKSIAKRLNTPELRESAHFKNTPKKGNT